MRLSRDSLPSSAITQEVNAETAEECQAEYNECRNEIIAWGLAVKSAIDPLDRTLRDICGDEKVEALAIDALAKNDAINEAVIAFELT